MQEIKFTKEDKYCIEHFGYNNVGDYENLKQLEEEGHLIIEELEYRLKQKENIIKEVREYILQHCEIIIDEEKNIDIVGRVEGIPILEILDKGE